MWLLISYFYYRKAGIYERDVKSQENEKNMKSF